MHNIAQVVDRAKREDLNNVLKYSVSFIRNKRGEVITDRRFNTASLLEVYMGRDAAGPDAVAWSPDDPNILTMSLPGATETHMSLCCCPFLIPMLFVFAAYAIIPGHIEVLWKTAMASVVRWKLIKYGKEQSFCHPPHQGLRTS